ncbi:MAG: autoinducer binding domain-containing protein [Sterolibacteriaceae bacterium MAG5]|nr:autoinducer binding domain-containing protein [Candidatus Nitricoxidireducens bremensis]
MELYLFENLLKARDEAELTQTAQHIAEKLGFDYFCYALSYRKSGEPSPQHFTLGTYPEIWLDRYFSEGFVNIDPSVLQCFRSTIPVIWTHRMFSAPKVIDMHHEAGSIGIRGGVCLPIHSPWLNGAGLVGLANGEDTDKAVPHVVDTLGKA